MPIIFPTEINGYNIRKSPSFLDIEQQLNLSEKEQDKLRNDLRIIFAKPEKGQKVKNYLGYKGQHYTILYMFDGGQISLISFKKN